MSKKQTIHTLKTEIAQLKKGACKPYKNMRKAELVAYLAELKGGSPKAPAPAPAQAPVKKVKKKVVKKPRQSLKEFKEEKEGKEEKKQAPPLPKSKPPPRMKIPPKPSFKPPPIPTAKKAKEKLTLTFQQKASKSALLKKIRKFNKDFSVAGIKKMLGDITEQNRDERVKRLIQLFKNDVFDIGKDFQVNKKIIEKHSTPANKKLIEQYSNTGNSFGPNLQTVLGM